MVAMNLLPWRAAKKRYEKKIIITIQLLACVATAILLLVAHLVLSGLQSRQLARVATLQTVLEKWSTVASLLEAQHARLVPVANSAARFSRVPNQLFVALGQGVSARVCFTEMSRTQAVMTFSGVAHSAADLMAYLQKWPAFSGFSALKIEELHQQDRQMQFRFQAFASDSISH